MKRHELLKHLRSNGCKFIREGSRHSWWHNPELNKRSSIPRHSEISNIIANKICKDLSIPPIK
ncbi:MAG: type II toxin-antitoxin system HicA family toxin [Candidatus Aminicenantes bacterium]|nr:type II toxin-antitoxin system HicA family toxin [Candidatus Aminicenantes bacterium]